MARKGVPLIVIQRQLGHSNPGPAGVCASFCQQAAPDEISAEADATARVDQTKVLARNEVW
jgi:hypothetical protein